MTDKTKETYEMIPTEKECWNNDFARQKRADRASKRASSNSNAHADLPPLRPSYRHLTGWDFPLLGPSGKVPSWTSVHKFRPDEWCTEADLYANEIWKARTIGIIAERISRFEEVKTPILARRRELHSDGDQHDAYTSTHASRRVLDTTELLDAILQASSSETQLVAYNVDHKWRAVVERIIKTRDRAENLSGSQFIEAVQYGDLVTAAYVHTHITDEELDELETAIDLAQKRVYEYIGPDRYVYLSARLTQAPNVSNELSEKVQVFEDNQYVAIPSKENLRMHYLRLANAPYEAFKSDFGIPSGWEQPTEHRSRWLDFSQFVINPYFKGLFGTRLSTSLGRCDISLEAGSARDLVVDHSALPAPLLELLQSMFVTQPPCKTIGLYT